MEVFKLLKKKFLKLLFCLSILPTILIFTSYPVSANNSSDHTMYTQTKSNSVSKITEKGKELRTFLNDMDVENYWLSGKQVNWKTGKPIDKEGATHCSAFVAAAAYRLNIYILRPPEHGQKLLANAQQNWLKSDGADYGWNEIYGFSNAQSFSNKGYLVVASYKNHNPEKSGHIAIVRPFEKSTSKLESEGPQIIQAGGTNYNSVSLKTGFKGHPSAMGNNEILFFVHSIKNSELD